MVMKNASGVIALSGRVPGRASGPFRSRGDVGGGLHNVSWKLIRYLGFPRRLEYIGGRATSGGGPGAHTITRRGQGVSHAMAWCGYPLAPLRLCFGLYLVSGKIGTLAFVSSNSKNISYVAFLKHKNSRKQGTGTVASR
jgi:hypothetical protein